MRSGLVCLGFMLSVGCSGAIDVGPGESGGAQGSSAGAQGSSAGAQGSNAGAQGSNAGAPNAGVLACQDPTLLQTWPTTTGCTSGQNLALVGTWHGYVEGQAAPWDDLTLVVNGASVSGGLCGTLKVGAGPAPAPATDPNVGYPDPSAFLNSNYQRILPGFTFTLLNATTDGTRVRFSIGSAEPWRGWCGLQASYSGSNGTACNCLPNWASEGDISHGCKMLDPAGIQDLSVNCARLSDCSPIGPVCQCNAAGCSAALSSTRDFDLRFTGETGEGSSAHFDRVP